MFQVLLQGPVLVAGLLLALTAVWFVWGRKRRFRTLPPGPPPNPIFGNIFQIRGKSGKDTYRNTARLVEKYGKNGMGTIYLGNRPNVFVSDYETIKKILNADEFTGRPLSVVRDELFRRKGLIFTEGELWKEQRRFALSTLRDFGMGKSWLQDLIIEEAQELVEDLAATKGAPVNPNSYFTPSVSNVICAISYGERFSHKDEKFRRLTSLIGENIQLGAKNQMVETFPFLRFLPFSPFHRRYLQLLSNFAELTAFFDTLVKKHEANLHDGEPRDYLHAFMLESEKQQNKLESSFTSEQLMKSVFNLFGAGTETTATTLAWAIIYLLENPKVYDKVQAEIDSIVGDGRYPTLEDKDSLPYAQATIFEVQRLGNLVPFAGRRAMEDVTLHGFKIPTGTNVFPMLSAVHEDPKYFPDPTVFKPERFLDEAGRHLLPKVEGFFPFSVGKRFCLGESLAKMELFIFFVSLVKHFRFKIPPGTTISSHHSILGVVNSPKPFVVSFEPRF